MIYFNNIRVFFALLILITLSSKGYAVQVDNGEELRKTFDLSKYINLSNTSNVTIAILDKGFGDFKPGTNLLPPNTSAIITGPISDSQLKQSSHGLEMAQIVWETTGKKDSGPKFLLFQAEGLTNLKAAISKIIAGKYGKVDVVLHSINYTSGGNFDGNGFINEEFNKLTKNGITVINAAGNFKDHVYNGPVKINKENFLKYKKEAPLIHKSIASDSTCKDDTLCFYNDFDENIITITLSWNDFTNDENYNTKKDLDLFLFDKKNNDKIAESTLLQKGAAPAVDQKTNNTVDGDNRSAHARERIKVVLNRGWYRLKTKYKPIGEKNFSQTELDSFSTEEIAAHSFNENSKIRISLTGDKPFGIYFQDRTSDMEIMIPSDNPNVITVGDTSPVSSTALMEDEMDFRKPDILLENLEIYFSSGLAASGTSSSAAIFAGMTVLLKGIDSKWTTRKIKKYSERFFTYTPSDSLIPIEQVPAFVRSQLPQNTRFVIRNEKLFTTRGYMDFELPTAIITTKPENLGIFRDPNMIMRYREVTRLTGITNMSDYYLFLVSSSTFPAIIPRKDLYGFYLDQFRVVEEGANFEPVNEISAPTWKMPNL